MRETRRTVSEGSPADTSTEDRIDLYRRASVVLQAKQFAAVKEEPTELALQSPPAPVTPADLAKRFTQAKPEDLTDILETLATLGRAHRDGERLSS